MRLSITAIWFLAEFAVGTMAFTLFFTAPEIRRSFHRFNFILAAVFWLIVVGLAWGKHFNGMTAWNVEPALAAIVAAILCLFLAWRASGGEKWQPTKWEVASWILPQALCAVPVFMSTGVENIGLGNCAKIGWVTSAFLLGSVHVGMILGHWYLIMRNLSFVHLVRASKLFLAAVVIRIGWTMAEFGLVDGNLREQWLGPDFMFVVMRCTWGLLAPLVMAFLTLRLAKTKNNQAATGMLYVCEFCVLGGEAIAAYLRM